MITGVKVRAFRGLRDFELSGCSQFNVLVGDNGVGKTALLEAIFITLCGDPQQFMKLRQWRHVDGELQAAPDNILAGLYSEFFSDMDFNRPISIEIESSGGPEARSLRGEAGQAEAILPTGASNLNKLEHLSPLLFRWKDRNGVEHVAHSKVTEKGLEFKATGEEIALFHFFAAGAAGSSKETAERFSDLRKARRAAPLIETFTSAFEWIEDLSVESYAGVPMVHAAVKGAQHLIPITAVSGALNRVFAIMVAIASRQDGIVLVDEIEDGIYFRKQGPLMEAMFRLAKRYNTQMFMTTHSEEWLSNIFESENRDPKNFTLFRLERGSDGRSEVSSFGGETFRAAALSSGEIR